MLLYVFQTRKCSGSLLGQNSIHTVSQGLHLWSCHEAACRNMPEGPSLLALQKYFMIFPIRPSVSPASSSVNNKHASHCSHRVRFWLPCVKAAQCAARSDSLIKPGNVLLQPLLAPTQHQNGVFVGLDWGIVGIKISFRIGRIGALPSPFFEGRGKYS